MSRSFSSSSSAPPASKKPKVSSFGKETQVTAVALSQVLQQARDTGIPEHSSPSTIARERHKQAFQETPYGKLLRTAAAEKTDGTFMDIPFESPLAALHVAARDSEMFSAVLRETLEKQPTSPSNPLSIVLYNDEITPNDPLKTISRKTQTVYWSIEQFPPTALCKEEFWFALSTVRSDDCKQLVDGFAQVFHLCCQAFLGLFGGSVRDGVAISIHGEGSPRLMFLELGLLIGDERAIKYITGCKGSAGTKLCCICINVIDYKWPDHLDAAGFNVPSTTIDKSAWKLHTDASVRRVFQRLAEASEVSPAALSRAQQDLGYVLLKYNPFADEGLSIGVVTMVMFDWMHVYLADGIFDWEAKALIAKLTALGVGFDAAALHSYIQGWKWPKGYASGSNVCAKNRVDGTASEYLSFAPVFAYWIKDVVQPVCNEAGLCILELTSMVRLLDVIALLTRSMRCDIDLRLLDVEISSHLRSQLDAYGTSIWKWKSHAAQHLAPMAMKSRTRRLIPCFTHERKHRRIKAKAITRVNTQNFNMGVLEEVTTQHLYDLTVAQVFSRTSLASPTDAPKNFQMAALEDLGLPQNCSMKCARVLYKGGRSICFGDVALLQCGRNIVAADVRSHFSVAGHLYSYVKRMSFVSQSQFSVRYRNVPDQHYIIVPSDNLVESVMYSKRGEHCVVLFPPDTNSN